MGQKSMILASVLIIFTVIVLFIFAITKVVGNRSSKIEKTEVTQTQTQPTNLVPASEIVNSPLVYQGYTLEVDSKIVDWVTNKSFTLSAGAGGGGLFGGGNNKQLLVIAKNPYNLPQNPDDGKLGLGELTEVIAKGQIQIYNKQELEAALGISLDSSELALDNNNIDDWNEGPVLLLDSIVVKTTLKNK
jgi:hypothetical protein